MTKLRLKPGYLIQQIGSDKVLIPCGTGNEVDFSKMIVLNGTGALLAEKMSGEFVSGEELVEILMTDYEVDSELARADVVDFLNEMEQQGILQKEE